MPATRGDKIFAIGMTVAMLVGFIVIIFRAIAFWNYIPGSLDPAGRVPMVLGIVGMLVLASIIVGVYFHGRRQEISDAEAEERANREP
ncbi:MAG TPA: hypothetical protein VGV37_24350 [Aliidongia sp.]|uniref:hypothetical protein n=1 Tax=Aliidongia sp. TaxID=1914230 RepID=UPI002DDD94E0|nr:hypothetical protein [Aliidongia sp.]HEV2677684.1 hypothetical protein [Aliidongia sp.]